MNKKTDVPTVMYTANRTATFMKNIEGWVDRHGRYWGNDEHMARWSGCTHILCEECGKPIPKSYALCPDCKELSATARHKKRKTKIWDGIAPLYSDSVNEYFMDKDDLLEYMDRFDCTVKDLRLLICEPVYLRELTEDYFEDTFGDDCEAPEELTQAIDEFNKTIENSPPVSWEPGGIAVDISDFEGR